MLKASYSSAKYLAARHICIEEVVITFLYFPVFCLLCLCLLDCHREGKVVL